MYFKKDNFSVFVVFSVSVFFVFLLIPKTLFYHSPPFPIDVVYTWKGEEVTNNIRTSYNNELKYSLRSVELYAPWVNKIYILMNNPKKQPSWIKQNNKIIIVDHTETFPSNDYLPNTNSNAIETTIANIKGLSEHYVYFNDDIFLGNHVNYTDFFTRDGKAIVDKRSTETVPILKDSRYNVLNIEYPLTVNGIHLHIPITHIKSAVLEFNEKYADYINWIRKTKTRNMVGFDVCRTFSLNTPCQQIHYSIANYTYLKGYAELKNIQNEITIGYVESGFNDLPQKLNEIIYSKPKIFCINDTEKDPEKRPYAQKQMLYFFNMYYPNKASFEK
jgi:hypothetical protein